MRPSCRRLRACTISVTLLIALCGPVAARGGAECDEAIAPTDDRYGYGAREGDRRCEGMYESPISNDLSLLEIVAYVWGTMDYRLTADTVLEVEAPDVSDLGVEAVNVRATANDPATYYRMDAELQSAESLDWPADEVLYPMGLTADRVAVLGWVLLDGQLILVPLRVTEAGSRFEGPGVRFTVRTSGRIARVRWRTIDGAAVSPWTVAANSTFSGQLIGIVPDVGTDADSPRVIVLEVEALNNTSDLEDKLRVRAAVPGLRDGHEDP